MNPLQIIFIHKGNSWYLPYTLYQAHVTNPKSPIYLIGDKDTEHFPKWINHISYSQYDNYAQKLRDVYQHKSILGKDFELLCIERWFVLYEFLVDKKIENCVYLDSDILVYSNLSEVKIITEGYYATWSGFSAHSNYINNINALKDYCDNVIDSYTNNLPSNIKEKTFYYQRINKTDNSKRVGYIKEFIEICQQNNIKIGIVYTPEYYWQKQYINKQELLDTIKCVAAQYNIPFKDFSKDSIPINTDTIYYGDYTHLTDRGARKFTSENFVPYIKEVYGL